jgi:hypothetical protein
VVLALATGKRRTGSRLRQQEETEGKVKGRRAGWKTPFVRERESRRKSMVGKMKRKGGIVARVGRREKGKKRGIGWQSHGERERDREMLW